MSQSLVVLEERGDGYSEESTCHQERCLVEEGSFHSIMILIGWYLRACDELHLSRTKELVLGEWCSRWFRQGSGSSMAGMHTSPWLIPESKAWHILEVGRQRVGRLGLGGRLGAPGGTWWHHGRLLRLSHPSKRRKALG
jgi:hypothetical protein